MSTTSSGAAPPDGPSTTRQLGAAGEQLAAEWLESQGCVLLERNWRCRYGELDLIMAERGDLVICEVKTRSGTGFGGAHGAVDARKALRLRKLARLWLGQQPVRWCTVRFDVVTVLWRPHDQPSLQRMRGVV